MTDLPESVGRLVDPWVLVLTPQEAGSYRAQEFPPLLDMLAGLVVPGMEKMGGGSSPETRNLVDVKSLTLLMHIQDVVRAWLFEWGVPSARDLKGDVRLFHGRLEALYRGHSIAQTDYLELTRKLEVWAPQIWELVEPVKRVPIRKAACPVCGRDKWVNDAGEHSDNLVITYSDGGAPIVQCQWGDCATTWEGGESLVALGRRLELTLDEDVLLEMGIRV